MRIDQMTYQVFRAIDGQFGLANLGLVAGCVAGVAACLLMASRRTRRVGWWACVASVAIVWVGLMTVSESQVETRISPIIRSRSYAYDDARREAAQLGLILVPAGIALIEFARIKMDLAKRKDKLAAYLRIAGKAYLSGDFDRAIAEYSIAIRVEPSRIESYVKRGQAWMQKGEYDRSVADYDRALKLDPDLAAAYLNRGIVLAARGDNEMAVDDFDRALELGPTDATPILYRGLSRVKIGDPTAAAEDFRRVLRLTNHPDLTEPARFHLAMLEVEAVEA